MLAMCGQQLIVVPSPGDGEAELGDVVNAAQEVAGQRETGRVSENNILNISGQGKHNLSRWKLLLLFGNKVEAKEGI